MVVPRFAGLINALEPVNLQQITRDSPWNTGMKESTWLKQMNSVRDDMVTARSLNQAIAVGKKRLKVGPEEAERIANDARNAYSMRQVDIGVPHAYANENALSEALNVLNPTRLYNQGSDYQATDLEMMMGEIQQLVDVQTHLNPDRFNMGVLHSLRSGDAIKAWTNASNDDTLLTIASKLSKNQRNPDRSRDKLLQSRRVANDGRIPNSKIKDMIITGTLNPNAKRNLGDVPQQKGSYNYTPLMDVDVINMDGLRPELLRQTKSQLEKANIRPMRSASDGGQLRIGIPMDELRSMGGVTSEYLDDETIKLLTANRQ